MKVPEEPLGALSRIPWKLAILSITSGILSRLSFELPSGDYFVSFLFLPGLFFGVFVLAPLVERRRHYILAISGLIILSTGAYYGAVNTARSLAELISSSSWGLSTESIILSCAVVGGVATLTIVLSSFYLVPQRFSTRRILYCLGWGVLGGALIGLGFAGLGTWRWNSANILKQALGDRSVRQLILSAGYLIWQGGVALSLFSKPRVEPVAGPATRPSHS